MSRLAAGLGGPRCLVPRRRSQVERSRAAIETACEVLLAAGTRPSLQKALDAGTGFCLSTLRRHRTVLHDAQRRYDEDRTGTDSELLVPEAPAEPGEAAEAGPPPVGGHDDDVTIALLGTVSRPTGHDAPSAREKRLAAELVRRDGQLLHALGEAEVQRAIVRRQRKALAELRAEVAALSTEPFVARPRFDLDDDD